MPQFDSKNSFCGRRYHEDGRFFWAALALFSQSRRRLMLIPHDGFGIIPP